jgi:hypothetical protein
MLARLLVLALLVLGFVSLQANVPAVAQVPPTEAWICNQTVQMGVAKASWCDDLVALYARLGITDGAGRMRPKSAICTDAVRSGWIRGIWDIKSQDLGLALFRAGSFEGQAEECFSYLSGAQRSRDAWKWRAAAGVLESYVAQWETDYGVPADQAEADLSRARTLLSASLENASFLSSDDLTVVRQRLAAISTTSP